MLLPPKFEGPALSTMLTTWICSYAAAALMHMKKKKLHELQLEQVDQSVLKIMEQQSMLEGARVTLGTVGALAGGAQAMKANMSEMKIDKVDTVLEEINEANAQMQEVHNALAAPIGAAADIDEEELLLEMEVSREHRCCWLVVIHARTIFPSQLWCPCFLSSPHRHWCGEHKATAMLQPPPSPPPSSPPPPCTRTSAGHGGSAG
jgi:hypothetical protein